MTAHARPPADERGSALEPGLGSNQSGHHLSSAAPDDDGRERLLAWALAYAARGWRVFPLQPGTTVPAVRGWEHRAHAEEGRIRTCWAAGAFNIGVAPELSGLTIIELKTAASGERPPAAWRQPGVVDGADVFAVLAEAAKEPFPANTFSVREPDGTWLLYFQGGPAAPVQRQLGWKARALSRQEYTVGAGSVTPSGNYTLISSPAAAPLPTWVSALSGQPPAAAPAPPPSEATLHAALRRELDCITTAPAAPESDRAETLFKTAVTIGRWVAAGDLTEPQAAHELLQAATAAAWSESAARRAISNGLAAGATRPRHAA